MNHNLYTILLSLAVSGALLIVGLMAIGQAPPVPGPSDDGLLIDGIESSAIEAGDEAKASDESRQRHGRRAPLSMPYFSFAQSLRPRS